MDVYVATGSVVISEHDLRLPMTSLHLDILH